MPKPQKRAGTVSKPLVSPEWYPEIRKREWLRWRDLAASKEFIWDTFKLKYQLGLLLKNKANKLEQFFRPSFLVTSSGLPNAERRIGRVDDATVKAVLLRYTRYAALYDVMFVLGETPPRFRVRGNGFWGSRFDLLIRKGQLEPAVGNSGGDPVSDGFESDQVSLPVSIEELVTKRQARYVRLQDSKGDSILARLLDFSYSPSEITVIDFVVGSRTRRLFMVGENVALSSVWPELRAAVAELQMQSGGTDQRGKSADVPLLYSRLSAILRSKGTLASKAAGIVANEDRGRMLRGEAIDRRSQTTRIATIQSYLTQLKNKLEGQTL